MDEREPNLTYVRITKPPPGDAPDDIREAWVGLVLPLRGGFKQPHKMRANQIVSGDLIEPQEVFLVEGSEALSILSKENYIAANFYTDSLADVVTPVFTFPVDVCEVVKV